MSYFVMRVWIKNSCRSMEMGIERPGSIRMDESVLSGVLESQKAAFIEVLAVPHLAERL